MILMHYTVYYNSIVLFSVADKNYIFYGPAMNNEMTIPSMPQCRLAFIYLSRAVKRKGRTLQLTALYDGML